MRSENTLKSLENQILECKKQLMELARDIEIDEEKSKLYNKIIVQKAILVDRYKKLCYRPSMMKKIKDMFHNPFKKKEKLICDYFLT